MSHTYVQNLVHVVFSTKERRKLIPTAARLYRVQRQPRRTRMQGLCRAYGAHDPMHILPTALPWANLPVRLPARGIVPETANNLLIPKESDFAISSQNKIVLLSANASR